MRFWQSGAPLTVIILLVLLLGAELLARAIPPVRRLGLPLALLAGVLGLVLGEQVLGLFTLDVELLESIVYHGLALVFIAVGLQTPRGGGATAGSVSMAFAIVAIMVTQAALGLGIVLVLDPALHPGFGLLLPMGFEEGPGQGLSMGEAWEASGLDDGAQVGLIIAVIGYAWSVVAGIPLVLWGRRKGWVAGRSGGEGEGEGEGGGGGEGEGDDEGRAEALPGGLDALSVQLAVIGLCYLLTWAVCTLLATLLAGDPDIVAVVWGVHFIIGAGVAIGVRLMLARLSGDSPIDDRLMGRVGGLTVDVITCAALAAVQFAVLESHWLPIVLVTGLGGLWTLVLAVWLARRAWTEAPFEHAVLYFGMSTGTLPTGLTLLRMIDPDMRSPAPVSAVFGSVGAVAGGAVLLLGVFPMIVAGYSGDGGGDGAGDWPARGWLSLAVLVGLALVVFAAWRLVGGLRFRLQPELGRGQRD